MTAHDQRLLILDFGSQYTQLIARRVRESGVYCEIYPFDVSSDEIQAFKPWGIIMSGGPETVTLATTPRAPKHVFDLGVPVMGICYGLQTMAQELGGRVSGSEQREFGHAQMQILENSKLFEGIVHDATELSVWMSHGDKVVDVPPGFRIIGKTASAPVAAIEDPVRNFYGLQFHPEVTHTDQGQAILYRFCRDICGCDGLWTEANIIEEAIADVKARVGSDKVVLGLSGGVDSSVVAALLARAIGDQLYCVFVDNGLLRKGERQEVEQAFGPSNALPIHLITVDARAQFLEKLSGVDDPETKRRIIGNTFIDVFEQEATKIADVRWLAQGTIYPDVVESAASKFGKAHVIKSHHNVGGLPARMRLQLVEPLRELFKDEVRRIGLYLGLPAELINRHPFPGPGLAVRLLGGITEHAADLLREADAIFLEELRRHDLYDKVSQAFAVYLPVRSVGVVGDTRRYAPVIALRAVETVDFMTARPARLPYEFIEHVSNRIINEISGISRVVYDISSKPPATIEWE